MVRFPIQRMEAMKEMESPFFFELLARARQSRKHCKSISPNQWKQIFLVCFFKIRIVIHCDFHGDYGIQLLDNESFKTFKVSKIVPLF